MRPILHQVRVPSLPKRRREFARGASPAPDLGWIVNGGALSFTEGSSTPFNVAATGPSSYVAGGVYGVDVSGAALPSGMVLTDAGSLTVGSATAANQPGVVFSYFEPGALPTMTLNTGAASGVLPYMATVYPLEGTVPQGAMLVSPDDASLRSSVLSRWPDNSAQVMVLAGAKSLSAFTQTSIRLRPAVVSDTALTTAYIDSLLGDLVVNFGGGAQTFNNWTSGHDRTWWANSQVICARYRRSCGLGVLEAVIDVHAFVGGRVFVEVVVENSSMTTASPSKPAAQTYASASVVINGTQINGSGTGSAWAGGATHEAFRAWYCSGWVGGDPQIQVTHDTASIQAHPLLFKPTASAVYDFSSYVPAGTQFFGTAQKYGDDTYVPWNFGRHRWNGMGNPGDSRTIAYLPQWECSYVQTGSKHVRNAVLASGLALLSFPINYRDASGDVPTFGQLGAQHIGASFPYSGGSPFANYAAYGWDYAHCPAVGMVAFLCRPSPCFLEISQKAAIFNGLGQSNHQFGYWYETRGRAWCARNLGFAIFLTPESHPWKPTARSSLASNVSYFRTWETDPEQKLNLMWGFQPGGIHYRDEDGTPAGFQVSTWMHHFFAVVVHKLAAAKILTGSEQTELAAHADWATLQPVRFVNESTLGEWRYIAYKLNAGTTGGATSNDNLTSIGASSTWGAQRAWNKTDGPPALSGPFMAAGTPEVNAYASGWSVNNGDVEADAENTYTGQLWHALVAAVERDVSGAASAWATVNANVTNLATFKANGGKDCRLHHLPRNV